MIEIRPETSAIVKFTGDYKFLSNFYELRIPIKLGRRMFYTVEHAYQYCKTDDHDYSGKIWMASSAAQAKYFGKHCPLRSDWENLKVDIMAGLVWQKFDLNRNLAHLLLGTGARLLVEGNTWHDTFWGTHYGKGDNWLGKILIFTRHQLDRRVSERRTTAF